MHTAYNKRATTPKAVVRSHTTNDTPAHHAHATTRSHTNIWCVAPPGFNLINKLDWGTCFHSICYLYNSVGVNK